MIKGVTKNIIEISPSGNDYFERAIIILKEPCDSLTENELKSYACVMLGKNPPEYLKKQHGTAKLKLLAAAAAGALFSATALYCTYIFIC